MFLLDNKFSPSNFIGSSNAEVVYKTSADVFDERNKNRYILDLHNSTVYRIQNTTKQMIYPTKDKMLTFYDEKGTVSVVYNKNDHLGKEKPKDRQELFRIQFVAERFDTIKFINNFWICFNSFYETQAFSFTVDIKCAKGRRLRHRGHCRKDTQFVLSKPHDKLRYT